MNLLILSLNQRWSLANRFSISLKNDSGEMEVTGTTVVTLPYPVLPKQDWNTEGGTLTVNISVLGGMPVLFKFITTTIINNTYSALQLLC